MFQIPKLARFVALGIAFFAIVSATHALDLVPGTSGNAKGVFVLSDGELYLVMGDDPGFAHLVSFTKDTDARFLERARSLAVPSKPWPADYSDAPLSGFRATVVKLAPGQMGLRMESRPVSLDVNLGNAVKIARSICITTAMGDEEAQEAMQLLRKRGILDRALHEVLRRYAHGFED